MNKLASYRAKWQRFNAQLQARWQPLAPREEWAAAKAVLAQKLGL